LTDEELDLLRRIGAAEGPVMFQAEGRTIGAHVAFDHRVDVLRDLPKAGWIVLDVWVAEPGTCGHARRRYSAAQAYCTESGREALELIRGQKVVRLPLARGSMAAVRHRTPPNYKILKTLWSKSVP
jgi:hypothetical protein